MRWGKKVRLGMEELTRRYDNLSLSAREGHKVILSKKRHGLKHVLVAKFYTK